ncbi:unnamed protein product [Prorocentrum cordatum]|uniref:RanBP2-type domain-containing protein n=1 Tax=Prorocentrum cordatum TaxID=2364126 RepID=A0ABN9PKP0_9DINO|nr:unnamed protein product [Polarella glacialis]
MAQWSSTARHQSWHASHGQGWGSQSSSWWQCNFCSWWNTADKKKCAQCGCKKTWAQVATGHVNVKNGHIDHPVRNEISTLSGQVANMSSQQSLLPQSQPGADNAEVKQVDAALANLPPGPEYASARAELTKAAQAARMKIVKSKPLGAQLDSCKGALDRRTKRISEIDAMADKLQLARATATQEQERLQAELAELQKNAAQQPSQPNSIEAMTSVLDDVLKEMSVGFVDPQHVAQAKGLMQQLVTGIQSIAAQAQQTASVAAVTVPAVHQPVPVDTSGDIELEVPPLPGMGSVTDPAMEVGRKPFKSKTPPHATAYGPVFPAPGAVALRRLMLMKPGVEPTAREDHRLLVAEFGVPQGCHDSPAEKTKGPGKFRFNQLELRNGWAAERFKRYVWDFSPKPGTVDEHLRDLNAYVKDVAEWLASYICSEGGVFEQWNVDPKVTSLVARLHEGSWFSHGSLDTVARSHKGGRQGCIFGATVFNAGYSVPIKMLHEEMRRKGITLRVRSGEKAFRGTTEDEGEEAATEEEIIDATFVDDECIALVAASPQLLDRAIQTLLEVLCRLFRLCAMVINWAPGKTECMLRHEDGVYVKSDHDGAIKLSIVSKYKHLGTVVSIAGTCKPDAEKRASAAMDAYAPVAIRVFGAPNISIATKMHAVKARILTKLMFHARVVTPDAHFARTLNQVYMRVPRRIVDKVRFGPGQGQWLDVICGQDQRWHDIVDAIHFSESKCDSCASPDGVQLNFACDMCPGPNPPTFATRLGLVQHKRAVHSVRNEARRYVSADGVCPVCHKDFRQRFRCIRHLSGSPPSACTEMLRSGAVEPLPNDLVESLDSADRALCRKAYKEGHAARGGQERRPRGGARPALIAAGGGPMGLAEFLAGLPGALPLLPQVLDKMPMEECRKRLHAEGAATEGMSDAEAGRYLCAALGRKYCARFLPGVLVGLFFWACASHVLDSDGAALPVLLATPAPLIFLMGSRAR